MRVFDFHAPQERVEPKFWTNTKNFDNTNAGRYVRNALLDGKTYPAGEQCPAWLKTRDAVHPFGGMANQTGGISSDYGGVTASASTSFAILQPWNTLLWWSPGGNGVGSWFQVQLPEPTLVESYAIGSQSSTAPLSWKLEGSTDGETWTDVHILENTGVWDAIFEQKEITIPVETRGTYLYYRLTITASNATTMSLRNFRLFRPQSVCAKGQLLIDASAISPLIMSFTDGFEVDGVTPKDHVKSINASSLLDMFDVNGYPEVRHEAISANIPININAVLDLDTGAVALEAEDAGLGLEIVQASGGMTSITDKGWNCNVDNSVLLANFGNLSSSTATFPGISAEFRSQNIDGINASKLFVRSFTASGEGSFVAQPLYAIEMDGTRTEIGRSAGYSVTYQIGRRIKGIYFSMPNLEYREGGTIRLYSYPQPQMRINNGKLYTRDTSELPWSETHKVRIGSVFLTPDGEVIQPLPVASMQGQLNHMSIAEG